MKVKAKWAVKANGAWRKAGEVFEVDSTAGLLGAVEVLKDEPKPLKKKTEEVPAAKTETKPEEKPVPKPEQEAKAEQKPKTAARTRKKTTGK